MGSFSVRVEEAEGGDDEPLVDAGACICCIDVGEAEEEGEGGAVEDAF